MIKARHGPNPFRFENMWLRTEGFQDLLKGWWQGATAWGSSSFILPRKIKEIKILSKPGIEIN